MQAPVHAREGTVVVHPDHGVMRVVGTEDRELAGRTRSYVVLVATDDDLHLRVPVDRWDETGIRSPVGDVTGEQALAVLEQDPEELPDLWHQRQTELESRLHSGCLLELTTIVRDLNARGPETGLPHTDRELFRAARQRIIDELELALDEPVERVEELVSARLAG